MTDAEKVIVLLMALGRIQELAEVSHDKEADELTYLLRLCDIRQTADKAMDDVDDFPID